MIIQRLFVSLFILGALIAPTFALAQTDSTCTQSEEGGFVSLTCIKNLEFAGNAAELPAFLNSVYMICIGLAAVIGVLQIMRAGVTWMTAAGSHEAIGNAKNLITQTIIGLILVLAPTIVFSIINPEILSLKIGNLEKLAPKAPPAQQPVERNDLGQVSNPKNNLGGATIAPPPTAPGCTATIPNGQIIDTTGNKEPMCCSSQDSGYVDCQEQRRNREDAQGNVTSVGYCGCSIKPNLGMEYYDLYSAPFYQTTGKVRYETDLVKEGTTPQGTAAKFNDFQKGCTDAGGKFEAKSTRSILQSKYIECPADAGAPASSDERAYRCMPMKATCTQQ